MNRLALALLACLSLSTCGQPAFAFDRPAVEKRAEELSEFVRLATGYKITTKPRIFFQPVQNLNRIYYGAGYSGQDGVQALTLGSAILLRDDIQVGRDDDVLVHELVHFMQFESGKDGDGCAGRMEPEAYHVQDIYRVAHGLSPISDGFTLLVGLMACSGQ